LCKIYILNKYFTKKSEKITPLALRKFILMAHLKSTAKIQKIIEIVSKMLIKIDTQKYTFSLRF
jgi:hypothetical protein